jgi:tRNA pseudouridine55 synthase
MGRKTKDSGVDGVIVIDKPPGWTSHDVVAKCRGAYGQRRCGHSGTLDPDATGVLLIGFGQATKLLPLLTALPKTYTTEIVLGTTTSTLDDSGEVTGTFDMGPRTVAEVHAAAQAFVGDIEQIPPMVSAVQVDGVRLHQLARQGIEIERKPRKVTVYRYEVTHEVAPNVFAATVVCGSGTYVRTLVDDLGRALGASAGQRGGAHLRNLRRTHVGSFQADGADAPGTEGFGTRPLLTPAEALRDYPSLTIDPALVTQVRNGVVLDPSQFGNTLTSGRHWCLIDPNGDLLAVYERSGAKFRPLIVLPQRPATDQ